MGFFSKIGNAFKRDPARTEQAQANYNSRVEGFRNWQKENRERRMQRMKEDTTYYREAARLQREKARYQKLKGQTRNPFMELLGGPTTKPARGAQSPMESMWGPPPAAPVRRRRRRRRLEYVIVRR